VVPGEDDDTPTVNGPRYRAFLAEVSPLILPRVNPIAAIVTGRLERHRGETVAWLDRHGIKYRALHMWPGNDPGERSTEAVANWKGAVVRDLIESRVFVESDPGQAQTIADVSGKWVICPALGRTLLPR
jgi:hypothetical protein